MSRDPPQRREARFAKRRCALHPGVIWPGCRERRLRRDKGGASVYGCCKPGFTRQGWKPGRAETAWLAGHTMAGHDAWHTPQRHQTAGGSAPG
ncbi:hypothetical protein IIJ84_004060 [Salmonella enterica subsp. enterica serovar Oranienburg]|nr:hypothetical protein [Salmonella enterica subsp. enterica serovar Oranienburg]